MSSFNNIKVYLEAANMYMDQINFTSDDINKRMKEYIEKVRSILYPVKEQPKTMQLAEEAPVASQNAGFADIFVLCVIIAVYAIIIVNLILKLV